MTRPFENICRILIMALCFQSCTENQASAPKSHRSKSDTTIINTGNTFMLDCSQPPIDGIITRTDTTGSAKEGVFLQHSFDKKQRLVRVIESNFKEKDPAKSFSATTIYDTVGHIIYQDKTDHQIRWHCYRYRYDEKGFLVYKSGYSSGQEGIKLSYFYEGDRLVKEIREKAGERMLITY
jgi:hypothetical protein